MKLSWSHKLFLRINNQVGKRRWLDLFMIFCARWLIYILLVPLLYFGWVTSILAYKNTETTFSYTVLLTIFGVFFLSYIISLILGIILKKKRPVRELPNIKTLVPTLATWKSFPSDHTMFSFLMAYFFFFFNGGFSIWFVSYFFLASLVAVGRVYTGVHYPRDILGGFSLASLAFLCYYLLITIY